MRLKELREARSLSQDDLGNALGLSKSSISNYENGYRQPDMETLISIADYFDVTVDYVVGRSSLPNFEISPKEEIILQVYRSLPEDKRDLILELFLALKSSDISKTQG